MINFNDSRLNPIARIPLEANRAPFNVSPDLVIAGCPVPVRSCVYGREGVGSAHCSLRMQERVGRVIQARSELCTTRTLKYRSAVDPRV